MCSFCTGQAEYDYIIKNRKKYPRIRGHSQNKRNSREKSECSD